MEVDKELIYDSDDSENIVLPASTQKSSKNNDSSLFSNNLLSQISFDATQNQPPKGHFTSTPFVAKKLFQKEQQGDEEVNDLNEIQNLGLKRKRKLEDLFGDLHDIVEEDDDVYLKKHKTEEDRDLDTIQKILDARKVFETCQNPMKKSNFDRLEALHRFKKNNLSTTIPRYTFESLIRDDDTKIYVRLQTEEIENREINDLKVNKGNFFSSQSENIWQEANQIVSKQYNENRGNNLLQEIRQQQKEGAISQDVDLWVEKYRPKKYIDLLSDESINRSMLQWIKLWDKVVFNREVGKKSKNGELSNFNKKTGRFEQNGGWQKRKPKSNLNTELDENNIPKQKIVLLAGKPGVGKTTLAHVIAKHAGYEVREENASDDRTIENFKQTLENCTQMQNVLNRDNRPNCIIFDEIDGAPIRSVEYLVRFVTGQIAEKGKKGKSGKKILVKRPIICICNDMYGANLRALKQIAFVVNFQSIDNSRLAERLLQIANKERVKTDLTTMLTLAEKSDGDIRSCISVIQFYASMKKPITLFEVLKSTIGQKDQHKTLFNVWSSIFQIQRPKKIIKQSETNDQKEVVTMSDMMSLKRRMTHVLDMVSSCGEYEKLWTGIFENFPKQKFSDSKLENLVESASWFCFNDRIQNKINSLQNYIIYPYLQFAFAAWHFNFSSMKFPQITYPHKQFEVNQKWANTKHIFDNLKKLLSPPLLGFRSGHTLQMDILSLLKIIIYPEIRSVSMHLLSQKEKTELQHTVEIIADFGLTFVQYQSNDGTYVYRCEPDIDHFDLSGIPVRQISYWSKQILAQQVEREKMRRVRPKVAELENQNNDAQNEKKTSPTSLNKKLPNHLQKLIPKSVATTEKKTSELVCKDFFGRIVTKQSVTASSSKNEKDGDQSKDVFLKSPVWLKFKEGFNNAVRTDIHFSDLLISKKLSIIAALLILFYSQVSSLYLDCDFQELSWPKFSHIYSCNGTIEICSEKCDYVERISNNHLSDKDDSDVHGLLIYHSRHVTIFPKNIGDFFPNLLVIDMEGCGLFLIESSDIAAFTKLQLISFEDNKITILPNDLFQHNLDLKEINFRDNFIMHIGYDIFSHLNHLMTVDLRENLCTSENFIAKNREQLEFLEWEMLVECPSTVEMTSNALNISNTFKTNFKNLIDEKFYYMREKIKEMNEQVRRLKRRFDEVY